LICADITLTHPVEHDVFVVVLLLGQETDTALIAATAFELGVLCASTAW